MRALSLISWILVMVLVVGHIMSVGTADAQYQTMLTDQGTILTDQAVAYQINPSHSGFIKTGPPPPLQKRWEVDLSGPISYPLIAEGKVFVTVANTPTYGTRLYALDAATGQVVWGPINISGTYYWSNAAYEAGRVFVVNFDGLLKAFDAGTGTLLWSRQLPGQYAFSSPPTAFEGIVYIGGAGSGGTVYAVDAENGAVLWTTPVENGDRSSPAISLDGVYVSYVCAQIYKFDRLIGALLWHYSTSCSGGGGRTPVYYRGRLYVRDFVTSPSVYILDSETGNLLEHYDANYNDPSPAFDGDLGVFLNYRTLEGRNLETGAVIWSFAGDGGLSSAPIIVNRFVYIGSTSGNLYALDGRSGQEVWSTNVGAGIPGPDEHNVSQPLTGLGAGKGLLVIPAGNLLIAFESHFDTVQEIYIGYFHRPADPGGLIYWTERLDATGGNLTEIIEAFANSPESQALYGSINSSNISTVVNGIYNALFGRDAEAEGLNYYVNGFNSGQFTAATIMLNVLYGAQNEDLQSVNNKVTAADLFTWTIDPELDGVNFQATYAGDSDAIAGRNFVNFVTWDSATVPTQDETTAYIKTNIANAGDPILDQIPSSQIDIFTGEALFNAVVNPNHVASFNTFPIGFYPSTTLTLGEVIVELTYAGSSPIYGPDAFGSGFTTNFLSTGVQDGSNNVVITFPYGTGGAGMKIVSFNPVTVIVTDFNNNVLNTSFQSQNFGVSFLGFYSPVGIKTIRISSPYVFNYTPIVNIGDITYHH